MANSGPGWEGVEIAWGHMVHERNAADEQAFFAAVKEAEAAVLDDEDESPAP